MDKDKFGIILISTVIIVAGCTDTSDEEETEGQGLVISQLDAIPTEPFTGESTNIEMQLVNQGDTDADIKLARLYGHVIASDDNAWSLDGDSQTKTGLGIAQAGSEDFEPLPKNVIWRMTAPEDIPQTTTPYTWNAAVYYEYNTSASTSIDLIDSREESSGLPGVSNSAAPVRLDVTTQSPVLVNSGTDTVRVRVEATNLGQGEVYSPETEFSTSPFQIDLDGDEEESDFKGKINLTLADPPGTTSVNGDNTVEIDMARGTGIHTYELDLPDSFSSPLTVQLSLNSNYIYRAQRSVGVTVGER